MSIYENNELWASEVASIVSIKDDPSCGVMPLTYVGVPFLGFGGILAFGYNHLPAGTVAIGDASVIAATWAITYLLVFLANKRAMARATTYVASCLKWLASHIGDELTRAVVASDIASNAGHEWQFTPLSATIAAWRGLFHSLDAELLDAAMAITARNGNFRIVHAIIDARHPRTMSGWTTNPDVVDVTETALSALVTLGEITGELFRAQIRKELYQAA